MCTGRTFYPQFTAEPAGRKRVSLPRLLQAGLAGDGPLPETKLGVEDGQTSKDGGVSLETVECLGACDCGPALSVDDELIGPATRESVDKLASEMG